MSTLQPRQDLMRERFGPSPVTFEIIPPEVNLTADEAAKRNRGLEALAEETRPDGINIPEVQPEEKKDDRGKRRSDFQPRIPPRDYVRQLRDDFPHLGEVPAIVNRVIVKHPEAEQETWLDQTFHEFAIENVVLVGGESSDETYPGPSVPEGNRLVREGLNRGELRHGSSSGGSTDYLVGNISIPSRRGGSIEEPERMLQKITSGADFFTSQILFESADARRLIRELGSRLKRESVVPPLLLWSFTPVQLQKDVDFLRWLGVLISDDVEERILSSDDPLETSIQHVESILRTLREINRKLDNPFPMGVNVSFMGLRNLLPAQRMARRLRAAMRAN